MTDRIYYTDAYRREFEARVIDRADGGRRIYLDTTAFYPTSGGQPNDLGELAGIGVLDVVDEGDRVAHVLSGELPESAASHAVRGAVDWRRRFDHMQQHTGQHLLSAVFEELFGYHTVSVHFGPDSSTLDLDTESIPYQRLLRAERRANEVVFENRPVTVGFEDAATATGLRKSPDRAGILRVVTIRDLDRSACGGTHVAATGEIGAIMLRRVEHIRKSTRVEFLCGARATARARADYDALTMVATALSGSIDDLPTLVAGQADRLRESEQLRRRLEREVAGSRARSLHEAAQPAANGVRYIDLRAVPGRMDDLRLLAQAALELPKTVVVASLAEQPSVLVAVSDDAGLDAGRLLKEALGRVGGRGGGSARIAQGTAPAASLMELHRILAEMITTGNTQKREA